MISESVGREIGEVLGAAAVSAEALSGGCINQAFAVTLEDGRAVFVKENADADSSMFPAEARGLSWLAEPEALRVPEVLAVGSAPGGCDYLVLELIRSAPRRVDFDDELGRGMAALHRAGAARFGLDHDNFIGSLPQDNTAEDTWASFYRRRRLEPQIRLASERGLLERDDREGLERLCERLPELVPDCEPARLHGDLWGGNLHVDDCGAPCLIDPAAYAGHREVDLAMMQLFGGFGPRVFQAYDEAHPLDPGWRDRSPLYQLYYLLVHVNLFGRGYLGQTRAAYRRYL